MGPLALLSLGIAVVVCAILFLRWHPFVALLVAALFVALLTPEEALFQSALSGEAREWHSANGDESVVPEELAEEFAEAKSRSGTWFVSRVTEAFGSACGGIGLVIAMAAIIGKCLLDSGGARRIVDALMGLFGLRGTPFAFAASSFFLGIPIFFDTVFYLLIPLGKAMGRKIGKNYLLFVLTIVAGATMAHSLVPPTPGPLAVAGFFGEEVGIGSMMLGGLVVGAFSVASGIAFAFRANRIWTIPLRETLDTPPGQDSEKMEVGFPPLGLALLPILLPVTLIGGATIFDAAGEVPAVLQFLGDKNIALMLSAAAAVCLLVHSLSEKEGRGKGEIRSAIQSALADGGTIILITAAGSAFGSVLRDTGIAMEIAGFFSSRGTFVLIPLAYLITALVRTAQGSATVAMITAGGIVGPLAIETDLGYSALYLALAIGCGSKPISWANDSGFWVIGRMSGMTPMETFKTVSVMMILMSLVGLGVVVLGALFFPMA